MKYLAVALAFAMFAGYNLNSKDSSVARGTSAFAAHHAAIEAAAGMH